MGKGESDERIARYTAEELAEKRRRGESLSDWERVRNMTEEELEASIDFEEEGEVDWDNLEVNVGSSSRAPLIRIDGDIIDWFRKREPEYQVHMNQVLRSYIEAHVAKEAGDDKDRKAS